MSKMDTTRLMQTLRPLETFAHQRQFSKPRTAAEVTARLEINMSYFFTNYLVVCAVVLFLAIITRPFLIFMLCVIAAMWYALLQKESVIVGGYVLKGKTKMTTGVAVSIVTLLLTAGSTVFAVVGVCATIVVAHAVAHKTVDGGDGDDDDDDVIGRNVGGGGGGGDDDLEGGGGGGDVDGVDSSSP